ncbi:L-threonylcarbamoyladenylate synthase [Jeotgalibacillus soli]|uniref:Threonylcarbamoyl-AMP synthase n=1 Tax=Jeotgalibacillus soli TaxID=889306 RepID=A0A0C2VZD9_9BACL|nr:L-threonylcarbamoyladenylate synthase [Jeotgalibacillus soli]KIL49756.1 sua5/yciO/yrdC/ywlC family protein [Jeotgalibacillus soli]
MNTTRWNVNKYVDKNKKYPQIEEAAQWLRRGEVIAFPTETVYGLGADATSDEAVEKIFAAKGRPSDNPLIVHISSKEQLTQLVTGITEEAEKLMERFWPGPLTIIFPKKQGVFSKKVTAGLETVGIRMPSHPVALQIISASGLPIAAPSANRSGKPSPTTADHVMEDLNGRIAGLVDGGETGVGVESTVVDCSVTPPMVLRPGGVTMEEIRACIGQVEVDASLQHEAQAPRSPGMKYTHYAPQAPLYVTSGSIRWMQNTIRFYQQQGKKVGVLATSETTRELKADLLVTCGSATDLSTVAHFLYQSIRSFDHHDIDLILAESYEPRGMGAAIMNRLEKAAGHKWLKEGQEPVVE